jgi:hypothetical protein
MGSFFTNIQVRSEDYDGVVDALRNCNGFPVYISKVPHKGWISIYPESTESQDSDLLKKIVTSLSRYLETGVFGLLVHDSDLFWYVLSERGKVLDEYDSEPGYFSGSEVGPTGGDLEALRRYCVDGTTTDDLSNLLKGKPKRPSSLGDTAALMKALSENNFEKMQSLVSNLDHDDVFRGDSLARKFGEKLGLPDSRVCLGYNYLRQGEGRTHEIVHIKDPDRPVIKKAASSAPSLKKEMSIDIMNPQSRRTLSHSIGDQGEIGLITRELDEQLSWLGSIANEGGASTGIKFTLKASESEGGVFQDMLAFVAKVPGGSPRDPDFQPADPRDEAFWPQVVEFKKSEKPGLWSIELPQFQYEDRITIQLAFVLAKPGRHTIELDVQPLDEQGKTEANFKFDVDVKTPKPKLKLIVTEPTKYKLGSYELTIPGRYEVNVQDGLPGMGGLPFAGMLGTMLQLNAVKDKYGHLNVTVVDSKMRRGNSDIGQLLDNVRVRNKIRDFKALPAVNAEFGGVSFKYAVFKCSEMRLFGLLALGAHKDKVISFTAQQRGEDITDEFEEILKSFRAV